MIITSKVANADHKVITAKPDMDMTEKYNLLVRVVKVFAVTSSFISSSFEISMKHNPF